MKIVRVLWGESEYIKNEIPKSPIFTDEIVFVWGIENDFYLKLLGYKTVLMAETITEPKYSTHLLHFMQKIFALSKAEEMFEEYLFLDWDVTLAKPLDKKFFESIRSGNDIQCPLYAYHEEYKEDIANFLKERNDSNTRDFLEHHMQKLYLYNWKHEDILALPCFCFFYSRKTKAASDLLKIAEEKGLTACIEEFAMRIYAECSLEEYISKYEPVVIRGKEKDKNLERMTAAIEKINNYVDSRMKKDIYLLHDIH